MYTLKAVSKDDFRRDVLKSDTAVLEVPQIELVMEMGTLGSMYTTVEGLLNKVLALIRLSADTPFRAINTCICSVYFGGFGIDRDWWRWGFVESLAL